MSDLDRASEAESKKTSHAYFFALCEKIQGIFKLNYPPPLLQNLFLKITYTLQNHLMQITHPTNKGFLFIKEDLYFPAFKAEASKAFDTLKSL